MRHLNLKTLGILVLFLSLLGCGEEAATQVSNSCTGDACLASEDGINADAMEGDSNESEVLEDGTLEDGQEEALGEDVSDDAGEEPDSTDSSDDTIEDSESSTDIDDSPDLEGPVVLSVSPDHDEEGVQIPFDVTITFSEPIREETVDGNTFTLKNAAGDSIGGKPSLSEDETTVTITPVETKQEWASPYTLEISFLVQDKLGNPMDSGFESRFYTDAPQNMELYRSLAEQFFPVVYQSVRAGNAHYDYPTRIDLDEDWAASNNRQALKGASEVSPALYWDVAETRSHVFLHYTLYYPLMVADGEIANPVASDTSGVIVTLFKGDGSDMSPVSVTTYGTYSGVEEVRAYQVEGSSLGNSNLVDGADTWENLAEGDGFKLWVSQPLHVACSWHLGGDGACELNEGILLELSWLVLSYLDGIPTLLIKDGGWPTTGGDIGVEMLHGLTHLWPRRTLYGPEGLWRDNYSFEYSPLENRPGGDLDALPSFFDPAEDHDPGRPPWAWRWKPGLSQFTDLPQGTLYLDPAFFFMKRHGIEGEPWEAAEGTGWSLEYCFHGALGIDQRGNFGECL